MLIGCDVDGVLSNCVQGVLDSLKIVMGAHKGEPNLKYEDVDWNFEKVTEGTDYDIKWIQKNLFEDEWFWAKVKPIQKNVDVLKKWTEEGHEVHILTGRPKVVSMVTNTWLKKQGLVYKHIQFCSTMHKLDYLRANEIPVMFEDFFFEANKVAAFGIKSFIVRQPWNQEYEPRVTNPLVKYISDLSEADDYINSKGVLINE